MKRSNACMLNRSLIKLHFISEESIRHRIHYARLEIYCEEAKASAET